MNMMISYQELVRTFPKWVAATVQRGSLLWLFQMLTQASMNISGTFLNLVPYMEKLKVDIRTGG